MKESDGGMVLLAHCLVKIVVVEANALPISGRRFRFRCKSYLESGRYQNASELLRNGLRLVEQRET